jgi:hypothetical protein
MEFTSEFTATVKRAVALKKNAARLVSVTTRERDLRFAFPRRFRFRHQPPSDRTRKLKIPSPLDCLSDGSMTNLSTQCGLKGEKDLKFYKIGKKCNLL